MRALPNIRAANQATANHATIDFRKHHLLTLLASVLCLISLALRTNASQLAPVVACLLVGFIALQTFPIRKSTIALSVKIFGWTFGIAAVICVSVLSGAPRLNRRVDLAAVVVTLLVAFGEEIFFRGGFWNLLQGRWGPLIALTVTSFAFALVHLTLWGNAAFLLNLSAGFLLGFQRIATGNFWASGVTHALANFL